MLRLYTDGSCINNGKKTANAGYAVVYPEQNNHSWGAPLELGESQTNQTAELRAIYEGLVRGKTLMGDPSEIQARIYTDSEFSINCLTKWITGWKKKNWMTAEGKPVVHRIIIEKITAELACYSGHVFTHVKAHTGGTDEHSKWNQVADELARKAVEEKRRVDVSDLETKLVRGENSDTVLKGIPLALMGAPVSETALFQAIVSNLESIDKEALQTALFSALKKTLSLRNFSLEKSKIHKTLHYMLVEKSHLTIARVSNTDE
jgi:ribonuclease HI